MLPLCLLAVLAGDAHFEVRGGKPVAGEVLGLDALTVTTPYGDARVPLAELLALRFDRDGVRAYTPRGELRGKLGIEHFEVRTRFGNLKVETASIVRVTWDRPAPEWRKGPYVELANGSAPSGQLVAETLRLETRYGLLTIPFAKVKSMWRVEDGFIVHVDGKRLKGKLPHGTWTLRTQYGSLRFKTAALTRYGNGSVPRAGVTLAGGHKVVAVEWFRGHTYLLIQHPRGTNWADAQDLARRLDGHVATISDAAENAVLLKLARRGRDPNWSCWIGLTDAATEGTWQWANGEKVKYTNWDAGEPNNSGDEDGTELRPDRDGRWNDVQLTQRNSGGCLIELDR